MKILGGILIVAGIGLGLYVGGYLCLYAGIITIIQQIALVVNGSQVVPAELALAIVKILGAGVAGLLSGLIPVAMGKALLD